MKVYRKLAQLLKLGYVRYILLYITLHGIVFLMNALSSQQTSQMSEEAMLLGSTARVWQHIGAMGILAAITMLSQGIVSVLFWRYRSKSDYELRKKFIDTLNNLPFKTLSQRRSGEILSSYANDIFSAMEYLGVSTMAFLRLMTAFVVTVGVMFAIDFEVAIVYALMFPIVFFPQVKMSIPLAKESNDILELKEDFNDIVADSLQNTSLVASYDLAEKMEGRYLGAYERLFAVELRRLKRAYSLILTSSAISYIPLIVAGVMSAIGTASGRISIANFILLISVSFIGSTNLAEVGQVLGFVRRTKVNAEKLVEFYTTPLEPDIVPLQNDGDIVMKDVTFSYTNEREILHSLNLTIKQGESAALVGPSGSGKSTLSKLLVGLYPLEGEYLYGGSPVEYQNARTFISYVPQDSFMFPTSIRENITSGRDDGDFSDAIDRAGLRSFIDSLPDGADTVLTEAGENLSGGQKQRIAIARALYRDCPVLLLDEVTSALDSQTEQQVLSSIWENSADKTIIMVAHRLSAARFCDKIYYMEDGRIVESGSYDELMQDGTRFFAMHNRQENKKER